MRITCSTVGRAGSGIAGWKIRNNILVDLENASRSPHACPHGGAISREVGRESVTASAVEDKQNEIQFLANKLQTKQQEAAQAVVAALAQDFQAVLSELINAKKIELVVTPQSLFYAKPELDITDDVTSGLDVRLAKKSEE